MQRLKRGYLEQQTKSWTILDKFMLGEESPLETSSNRCFSALSRIDNLHIGPFMCTWTNRWKKKSKLFNQTVPEMGNIRAEFHNPILWIEVVKHLNIYYTLQKVQKEKKIRAECLCHIWTPNKDSKQKLNFPKYSLLFDAARYWIHPKAGLNARHFWLI